MTCRLHGYTFLTANRDEEGHRTFPVLFQVEADADADGPAAVMQCPGLPTPGTLWTAALNSGVDVDAYAWFRQDMEVAPMTGDDDKVGWWTVLMRASTKPPRSDRSGEGGGGGCDNNQQTDPLLEPQKVSGSFIKMLEEGTFDRFNRKIRSTSHEPLTGPKNEWDVSMPTVTVVQNTAVLGADVWGPMVDKLNKFPLWGMPRRCWKMSGPPWSRTFRAQCQVYYTRTFTFELNVRKDDRTGRLISGWDRDLLDEGSKTLKGHWDEASGEWTLDPIPGYAGTPNPDPNRLDHFDRFTDRQGNPMRVILAGPGKDTAGRPAQVLIAGAEDTAKYYIAIASGTNNALNRPDKWVTLLQTASEPWDADTFYGRGFPVTHGAGVYLSLRDVGDTVPGENADVWLPITEPNSRGTWSALTAYAVGDTVKAAGSTLTEGKIHVEKYGEADFLLLGVPVSF